MDNLYLLDIDTYGIDKKDSVYQSLVNYECAQHVFKVIGENHLVAVVKGNVDEALDSLVGHKVYKVSCTPLIDYEQFTRETLNVLDSEVEKKGKVPPFLQGQDIYWLQFNVGYEGEFQTFHIWEHIWEKVPNDIFGHPVAASSGGRTLEELLKAMHDEAVVALGLLHGGQVPIAIYKSVAMREVHLFIQMEASALDKIIFTLPIIKALGDQVSIITKAVRSMEQGS